MRASRAWLALAVLAIAAAPADRLRRSEQVVARVPFGADTLRVVAGTLEGRPEDEWRRAVETVRIVDRAGRAQHAETLKVALEQDGSLAEEVEVSAWPVTWDSGPGLALGRTVSPSAPETGDECRYFAWREHRLVPLTRWGGPCGEVAPGDRVTTSLWTGYFSVLLPFRIKVTAPGGGFAAAPERPRDAGGLAALNIVEASGLSRRYDAPDTAFRVALHRAASGAAADSVRVSRSTPVEFVRAYADVDSTGAMRLRRVEVRIGGRHGFIDEADLGALGLSQAG